MCTGMHAGNERQRHTGKETARCGTMPVEKSEEREREREREKEKRERKKEREREE